MRALLLPLIILAACKGTPSPPDPKAFAAMTPEARCEAVAPRATQCVDELMIADLHSVGIDPALAKELETQLGNSPRAKGDEAAAMHKTRCASTKGYPPAVVACWAIQPCQAFVDCVVRAESKS